MVELDEKEKALLILERSAMEFKKCSEALRKVEMAFKDCSDAFKCANINMKRILNEEENDGNVHMDCEWYDMEKDCCSNYMMGRYCGLAFEVSKHKCCIKDMRL